MSIQEQKITEAAVAESGVQSQPDKLTGTAAQNKKVFDNLVTAVVRNRFNALLENDSDGDQSGTLFRIDAADKAKAGSILPGMVIRQID